MFFKVILNLPKSKARKLNFHFKQFRDRKNAFFVWKKFPKMKNSKSKQNTSNGPGMVKLKRIRHLFDFKNLEFIAKCLKKER